MKTDFGWHTSWDKKRDFTYYCFLRAFLFENLTTTEATTGDVQWKKFFLKISKKLLVQGSLVDIL